MKYIDSPNVASHQAEISERAPENTISKNAPQNSVLRHKLFSVRLVMISLISLAIGMILGMTLLPLIPSQALEAVLSSHIVRESATSLSATLPLQFVRLSVSCVPAFLLLSVAGVTSFCRGVTSLVLGISAIPQGCTLFWLYRRMGSDCLTTEGTYLLSPWLLFWAYCAFTVVRICLRIVLTLSSSHTAEHFFDSETRLSNGERGVSPLLARHLLICLLSAFAGALTCFAYIFVINTF